MLELSRDVETHRKIWVDDFYKAKLRIRKNTLNGKTLGIIGCGNIGSRVAKRMLAFEMNVLCYDPYKPAKDFPEGVEVVRDLDRIFKESDYVSLHAPNTPITRGMINKETLGMMKKDAFLINTARGALVNEADLYDALKNGVIRGAGIDALAKEPVDPKNPLLTLDNCIMYPHIGGNSEEAAERASYHAAMGVIEIAQGKEPTWPINDIDYATAPTYTDTKKPDKKPVGKYDY
jgi:D-3-phosphoglycerate dehydrogenase